MCFNSENPSILAKWHQQLQQTPFSKNSLDKKFDENSVFDFHFVALDVSSHKEMRE